MTMLIVTQNFFGYWTTYADCYGTLNFDKLLLDNQNMDYNEIFNGLSNNIYTKNHILNIINTSINKNTVNDLTLQISNFKDRNEVAPKEIRLYRDSHVFNDIFHWGNKSYDKEKKEYVIDEKIEKLIFDMKKKLKETPEETYYTNFSVGWISFSLLYLSTMNRKYKSLFNEPLVNYYFKFSPIKNRIDIHLSEIDTRINKTIKLINNINNDDTIDTIDTIDINDLTLNLMFPMELMNIFQHPLHLNVREQENRSRDKMCSNLKINQNEANYITKLTCIVTVFEALVLNNNNVIFPNITEIDLKYVTNVDKIIELLSLGNFPKLESIVMCGDGFKDQTCLLGKPIDLNGDLPLLLKDFSEVMAKYELSNLKDIVITDRIDGTIFAGWNGDCELSCHITPISKKIKNRQRKKTIFGNWQMYINASYG